MAQATSRRWILLLAFAAGVAITAGGLDVFHRTNDVTFCTSCHSMATVTEEYRQSPHFRNAAGIEVTCADCHVPKAIGPALLAKVVASKDVFHEVVGTIDTVEKFEARRWQMANVVWDKMMATDSRECRGCHAFANMDESQQDRRTARRHQRAEEKGQTCIECHKGVAHREPDPPAVGSGSTGAE